MTTPLRVDLVDISHHQSGKLDMQGARARGLKGLYHKATEGATFKDTKYEQRRKEAAAAKLPFGAYHFARPERGKDAVTEAKHFLAVAKPKPGDLVPALDIEVNTGGLNKAELTKWVGDWVAVVEKAVGAKPIIYTPFDLTNNFGCKLWVARYNGRNMPPKLPTPWTSYYMWQFSNGVYGVPDRLAGIGAVDLNVLGSPKSVIRIPTAAPAPVKPKKVAKLRFAHLSLQFSDSKEQQTADLLKVFSRGYDVITGTEAGHVKTDWNQREIDRIAKLKGYRVSNPVGHDTWVAVKSSLVASDWQAGSIHVLEQSSQFKPTPPGRWGDKGVTWASWNMGPTFGRLAVCSVHYLTWGGAGTELKVKTDNQYAAAIAKWNAGLQAGTEAFANGDFNRNDKKYDVFMGKAPFITCMDEAKRWENTGHGPIDGISREKDSKRVKLTGYRVLDDTELAFNTDHFLLEAEYELTAA